MKTKNFFAAMCGVIVLAGATITTYTAVTKSQKEMSDLTKQNLEALVQSTKEGGEVWDCKLTKDPCKIVATTQVELSLLNAKLKKLGLTTVGLNVVVDLTDMTCIYEKGGSNRCGNDVRCTDLKPF